MQTLLLGLWILPLVSSICLHSEICRAIDQIAAAYLAPRLTRPAFILGGMALLTQLSSITLGIWAIILFGTSCFPVLWIQRNALQDYLSEINDNATATYVDRETRRWPSVGLPLLLVTGFVTVIQQTDLLLIGWTLNIESAGSYKAAATAATPVGFVLTAVNAVAAPRFSQFHKKEKIDELQRFLRTIAHWLFWPTLCTGIIIALGSGFFFVSLDQNLESHAFLS